MPSRISYAQNGEDVRIWHAFGPREVTPGVPLQYVEVGANAPRDLSLTAALYDLGWRGLLLEPDPQFADALRTFRPGDTVIQIAAAESRGSLDFYRVPGTGLGTLDEKEALEAQARGFAIEKVLVATAPLDELLSEYLSSGDAFTPHFHVMSVDVEGAEASVLAGLSLQAHRPWVLCVESIAPGTTSLTRGEWVDSLLRRGYEEVAFDGINRWFVASERSSTLVDSGAGAAPGMTIAEAIATPFNAIDIGAFGWESRSTACLIASRDRDAKRFAWQRELTLDSLAHQVPTTEYERQISELREALVAATGGRAYALSQRLSRAMYRWAGIAKSLTSSRFVRNRVIRERHLRHVSAAMSQLTDVAYLGNPPADSPCWAGVDGDVHQRPPAPPGLNLDLNLDPTEVSRWLRNYQWDSDTQLESRMDNHDDEVGRVRRALQTRLWLREAAIVSESVGDRIAFDARSLQTAAFGQRGIGRFARTALQAVREAAGDQRVTLITDPGLPELPTELTGGCQIARWVEDPSPFGLLVQPSPMTHSPEPLIPLLGSKIPALAVVFDFIPLHYPSIYLKHAADRAEYLARLEALALYSNFVCISDTARQDIASSLSISETDPRVVSASVAWPRGTSTSAGPDSQGPSIQDRPIVLMTGDEPRKNTFGGLAGIAAATADDVSRNVVVVGMAGQEARVHHWSIGAAMRPGEAVTVERLSENELSDLLASAELIVVPSFDEGLSLPVIEAISAGTPVVASDIPSHRELLHRDRYLFNPAEPRSIARSIRKARKDARDQSKRQRATAKQLSQLNRHVHEELEDVISNLVPHRQPSPREMSAADSVPSHSGRLNIGVLTPWRPQRSGVADFSSTVFSELASHADVTVYTTSAINDDDTAPESICFRSISELFADPNLVSDRHDVLVSVVGNSHFHIPFIEALNLVNAVAIAHDARMVEYYLALRGPGGVRTLMMTGGSSPSTLVPDLQDQIDDMRLLQNAALWEVARRSKHFITHSPTTKQRIQEETGVPVTVLPFANQRTPQANRITRESREEARRRLGIHDTLADTIHIGSFGFLDPRTKMTDVVLESAGWLTRWGHKVSLHFVGAGSDAQVVDLTARADQLNLHSFEITGFQTEDQFQDWLLAVDLGVQLRVSPLLGVSGPLSDLAAFGTPAVASRGLCEDVETPGYIYRLPDAVSPVTVAEAIETVIQEASDPESREAARTAYLASKSPQRYARELLNVLQSVIE